MRFLPSIDSHNLCYSAVEGRSVTMSVRLPMLKPRNSSVTARVPGSYERVGPLLRDRELLTHSGVNQYL